MKIALGCDHGGFSLKETIAKHLKEKGYEVLDCGCYDEGAVDYPVYAKKATDAVIAGECRFGMLFCGTGIGMSMAANKVKGIRCALLSDVFSAKMTRSHNDANMLAMGARVIGPGLAVEIVDAFLASDFSEEEKHIRRIAMVSEIEKQG